MRELVVARKGELKGDAKGLDGHDGNGSNGRANRQIDESVLLSVHGCNFVNHEDGESHHCNRIEQEACDQESDTKSP